MMILANTGSSTASTIYTVVMVVVLLGLMYFMMIRPQQKETKRKNQMMKEMAVGDTVITTSGFYGVLIDICDEDTVIVEFGSNKNCRIPMQKNAIAAIEKPDNAQ